MSAPSVINTDYNQDILDQYGYHIFSNGTISNGSSCYLTFDQYYPEIDPDGTVYNGTTCDYPYYHIRARGAMGIVFGTLAILILPSTFHMLRKHGARHSVVEYKRFRLFGRRWQWYWLFVAHILAAVSGFMSIDIDRDYIQGTALTSYGAVYTAIAPTILCAVWEMTRHWCSFEERRVFEEDPFRFKNHDRRSQIHLIMPVVFYLFAFLFFLLTVLRNWSLLIKINSTFIVDDRWKVGAFFGFVAFMVTIFQVGITFHYYHPRIMPPKIYLSFIGVAAIIAYSIGMAFDVRISPFNPLANVPAIAIWGYLPILYIMLIMNICAYFERNEDLVIADEKEDRERRNMNSLLQNLHTDSSADTASTLFTRRSYTNEEIKAFAKAHVKESQLQDLPEEEKV
ncbi:hypothetical protein V1512DRAFT_235802 [Lipomyces arxii]|uniref:uncharacterized protein n=1 Tax=Lipomyces arxii TaxID=56418 RepID=UPI0034CD2DD4